MAPSPIVLNAPRRPQHDDDAHPPPLFPCLPAFLACLFARPRTQSKSGQSYRYTYLAAGRDATYPTPVGVVAKFDVEAGKLVDSWAAEPHEFISESVVVPRPGGRDEDDAYLMTFLFDGKTKLSQVLIFDAKAVGKGA